MVLIIGYLSIFPNQNFFLSTGRGLKTYGSADKLFSIFYDKKLFYKDKSKKDLILNNFLFLS